MKTTYSAVLGSWDRAVTVDFDAMSDVEARRRAFLELCKRKEQLAALGLGVEPFVVRVHRENKAIYTAYGGAV